MNNDNIRKNSDTRFVILFIIVITLSFSYLFLTSYAKYKRQIVGEVDSTIANWNIKVNNETIINKTTLSNVITPTFDTNNYVKAGVLAPGSTGSFQIVINASEVDVDFNYEITDQVDTSTPLNDLIITGYQIGQTTYNYTNHKITGEILKNTGDTTITFFFKWNDDNTNTMNNAQDTTYATTDAYKNTKIKMTLKFTQKNPTT